MVKVNEYVGKVIVRPSTYNDTVFSGYRYDMWDGNWVTDDDIVGVDFSTSMLEDGNMVFFIGSSNGFMLGLRGEKQ